MLKSFFISFGTGTAFIRPIGNICTSGTSQKFLPYLQSGCKNPNDSYICLKPLISTAGGRFNFITAQGRHLFKEATFTVSTLPRAWLEPPRSLRSLRGLKAHGTALSFVPPKTFCYSRRSRRLPFQSTRLVLYTFECDLLINCSDNK